MNKMIVLSYIGFTAFLCLTSIALFTAKVLSGGVFL